MLAFLADVTYDAASQTVTIGASLIWDIYAALEPPHSVNAVSGQVTDVDLAGFILRGGKTNFSIQLVR